MESGKGLKILSIVYYLYSVIVLILCLMLVLGTGETIEDMTSGNNEETFVYLFTGLTFGAYLLKFLLYSMMIHVVIANILLITSSIKKYRSFICDTIFWIWNMIPLLVFFMTSLTAPKEKVPFEDYLPLYIITGFFIAFQILWFIEAFFRNPKNLETKTPGKNQNNQQIEN